MWTPFLFTFLSLDFDKIPLDCKIVCLLRWKLFKQLMETKSVRLFILFHYYFQIQTFSDGFFILLRTFISIWKHQKKEQKNWWWQIKVRKKNLKFVVYNKYNWCFFVILNHTLMIENLTIIECMMCNSDEINLSFITHSFTANNTQQLIATTNNFSIIPINFTLIYNLLNICIKFHLFLVTETWGNWIAV